MSSGDAALRTQLAAAHADALQAQLESTRHLARSRREGSSSSIATTSTIRMSRNEPPKLLAVWEQLLSKMPAASAAERERRGAFVRIQTFVRGWIQRREGANEPLPLGAHAARRGRTSRLRLLCLHPHLALHLLRGQTLRANFGHPVSHPLVLLFFLSLSLTSPRVLESFRAVNRSRSMASGQTLSQAAGPNTATRQSPSTSRRSRASFPSSTTTGQSSSRGKARATCGPTSGASTAPALLPS